MEVLKAIPHLCYLLRDKNTLYLNTLCWRGPKATEGYSVLVELTMDERCDFEKNGIASIKSLATDIQQNANKYIDRALQQGSLKNNVSETIQKSLAHG